MFPGYCIVHMDMDKINRDINKRFRDAQKKAEKQKYKPTPIRSAKTTPRPGGRRCG